jgi:hypothetical protein
MLWNELGWCTITRRVTPSRADIDMTKQILDAAEKLDIEVFDPIIVGRDGHLSLRSAGLMLGCQLSEDRAENSKSRGRMANASKSASATCLLPEGKLTQLRAVAHRGSQFGFVRLDRQQCRDSRHYGNYGFPGTK